MLKPEPTVESYRRFAQLRIDAVNRALAGIPEDRVRYHLCWGSWHGPHTHDLPLEHIIDLILVAYSTGDSFARITSAASASPKSASSPLMAYPPRPVDMRWLLRRRHAARQALQVTLHSGRRPLKLLEVFFGQTIKSECAGLVASPAQALRQTSLSPGRR
jgi:hypothetical protein